MGIHPLTMKYTVQHVQTCSWINDTEWKDLVCFMQWIITYILVKDCVNFTFVIIITVTAWYLQTVTVKTPICFGYLFGRPYFIFVYIFFALFQNSLRHLWTTWTRRLCMYEFFPQLQKHSCVLRVTFCYHQSNHSIIFFLFCHT